MSGMIVAPEPLAVEEGAKVLRRGGNAVDAAVTCALVQAIVNFQNAGIAGYVILNLHLQDPAAPAGYRALALDAPALAGSKVTPGMWQDILIRPSPDGSGFFLKGKVNDQGYQSVCTPGTVKGLAAMLERWGTRRWADALAPAIGLAENGFMVDEHLAMLWKKHAKDADACWFTDYIQSNAEARRLYVKPDGSYYEAGDMLRNPDYARTLRRLAEYGPDDFYHGELAARMAADLEANGSFLTAQDIAEYKLRQVAPLVGSYRGHTVMTAAAPHGGPTELEILNILEGYDLAALGHNSPQYIHLVAMAMKAAFADRSRYLGDPEFVDVPSSWMTSKDRAAEWRARIDADEPITVSFMAPEPPDTTHVSVIDGQGNCVALTHSLGMSSGVITPGLGFMYNNSMNNYVVQPGHPNSIAPGKGRTTGMTPTIIYRNDRPYLVLGAPGATKIITSNVQVILNVIDFGMGIGDAVMAPRIDCQSDLITCHMRIPEYTCAEVRRRHAIQRLPQSHGSMGRVQAIRIDPETGMLTGASDTGTAGMALLVP